jgi:hypothetical protein
MAICSVNRLWHVLATLVRIDMALAVALAAFLLMWLVWR